MGSPKLSEAEREVLEILWSDPPHYSADIVARLADRGWSETTIKTLLARLVKKGFAAHEAEGRRYLYRPLVDRDQTMVEDQDRFLDRWATADGFGLLARFVEKTPLDARQIEELKRLLEEKNHGNS